MNKKNKIIVISSILLLFVFIYFKFYFEINYFLNIQKFYKNEKAMNEVVNLISSNALISEAELDSNYINLPNQYKHLSKNGRVKFSNNEKGISIFFFTDVSSPDLLGFIYIANENNFEKIFFEKDINKSFLWGEKYVKKINSNWYWIEFYQPSSSVP